MYKTCLGIAIMISLGCSNYSRNGKPVQSRISTVATSENKVEITGVGDANLELVLRIGKTKRTEQLEWTDSPMAGPFTAELLSTDSLKLDGGKVGNGLVFKVQKSGVGSISNIAFSDDGPVPAGTVRFHHPVQLEPLDVSAMGNAGNPVAIADIVCDDGIIIPVSILLRQSHSKGMNRESSSDSDGA